MKTKTQLKNKVNIVTLGCSKNLVDSEVIYTQLKRSAKFLLCDDSLSNATLCA